MKSFQVPLLVLNILILAGVIFLIVGPLGTRLERIESAIASGNQTRNRISGMVHRNQQHLDRLLRSGSLAGPATSTPTTESDVETDVAEPSDPELALLNEIESLEQKRLSHAETGVDSESFNAVLDEKVAEFASRGAVALAHLPERLRLQRDVDMRRFYLTEVLPRFENLDPALCFDTSKMVFLDAAADPSLRREALDIAFRYDRKGAEKATTDILKTIKRPGVQAAMLQVLEKHRCPDALDLILDKTSDPRQGQQVQSQAVQTLSNYPGSKTAERLRDIIENESQFLQTLALDALTSIEGASALPYLKKIREDSGEDETFPSAVMRKVDALIDKLESSE